MYVKPSKAVIVGCYLSVVVTPDGNSVDLGTAYAAHHQTSFLFHFRAGFDGASGAFVLPEQLGLVGTDTLAEEISP